MLAYLLKDILWLRLLTILSCLATITFAYLVTGGPYWTVISWSLLFTAINTVQIAIIIRERAGVDFTEVEKELHETLFKNFAPFEFMKLMRIGKWLEAKKGEIDLMNMEGPLAPKALLLAARIYDEGLRDSAASEKLLRELVKRFPSTQEGTFAAKRLSGRNPRT